MCRPSTVRLRMIHVTIASTANTVVETHRCSFTYKNAGVFTFTCWYWLPQRCVVMNSHIARAKLRSPTSVANVATNGGSRIDVISHVCSVPTRKPARMPPLTAQVTPSRPTVSSRWSDGSANNTKMSAHVVALNAIIDPDERSIPPAMITTAAPKATIPSSTVLRRIITKLESKLLKYV